MSATRGHRALEELLDAMLLDNEDITARGAVRRPGSPFKHASDITRHPERKLLLQHFRQRQDELRGLMEKADGQSKTHLMRQNARLEEANATLRAERDVLIASHRALLLAVGELGGLAAWKRFFQSWQNAQETIQSLNATDD